MNNFSLKTVAVFIMAIMLCGNLNAQKSKKELSKNLKSRIEKECRKTAKDLRKDGWEVMPGKLPIERQIQNSRFAELDTDEDGEKLYFIGTHTALGGNYSAAKKIASSRALTELAEQVGVKIASIVENNVSNINFGEGELEVIDNCISANKQNVSANLSGASAVLDIFKMNDDGSCEIRVMYQLNVKNALKLAKEIYRKDLQKKSASLSEKLDKLLL